MKTTANKMNGMHLVKKTSILFFWCIMMLFSVKSFSQTNKGQDFWLAETPNLVSGNFAISVANPGVAAVNIVITNPTRATVNATIAAGALQTFTFSTESGNIQNTGTYANNVYHVTAPSDVVVYDFTPLANAYSNDAALILPTNSLGKKYRPGSYVNALGNSNGSFFGVLATVNTTNVKTYDRTGTLIDNVTINQGQYFQRNNGSSVAQDITGWYIESDKPVAVFSGNICTSAGNSTSACDHIDEEVLPLESMASAYVACPTSIRPIGCTTPGSCSPDIFRYVATEDGTIITTSPNVGGGTINKGQFVEISTSTAHIVSSNNKPFYGYQYLISAGSGSPTANTGDPSLLDMPPVDQFQFNYIFLIPNTFAYNFINVVAPTGTTFTLDGSTLSNSCSVVGTLNGITYCTFHVQVTPGTHKIFANNQFGLIISGVDQYASYAYLGGVGLQPINAGCNTGGPYQLTTCSLAPIQLNGVGSCSDGSTPSSVQWTSADGVVFSNPNIANPTATVPGYGTFNICFTVTCGGNTVQCCSQITVNAPSGGCNTPPVAVCTPVTVSTNANCQGIAAAAAFNGGSTDADAGDVLTFSVLPAGPYSLGVTNVTFTATDSHGASSSCNTTITVVDNVKPTITCPSAITHTADAGLCSYSFTPPTPSASDNCSGVISVTGVRNDALALNAPYPVGTTTITWTATDASNNISAPCTQNIIVTDNEKPVITCGAAITHTANVGVCSYTFTPAAPSISDNCPGVTVAGVRSDAQPLSSAYPVGVTTITWTATDAHSNTNSCTQTVTVTDDENPVITCGAPITHTANTGLCSYSFTPTPATATDNCPGVTVAGVRSDAQSLTAPYPVGLTTITWTATDAHAHSVSCTQTVTITDDENPVINCLSTITHTSDAGVCTYSFTPVPPTATDNCPGVTVAGTRSDALALTAPYPFGNTTITWTATDAHAHSVSCTQVVNVTDNQKPVINNLPSNITINALNSNCANIVSWTKPTATDNCAIASFVSSDPFFDAAGYTFLSVGVTTVTYTATDIHGNVTTASFTVTVVDNQPPFLTGCPSNITVNAAAGRCDNTAIWNPPTASDNCPGVSLTTNHISGETFPVGTTVVTYTATDHAGLSVSCSFNVTVVDTQLPVITCGGPISVTNDAGKCGATVTVATPSATDNCPGVTVAGVRSDALALNALYPVGTTTITWTATDAHSNTATCTQTITVADNEFPVINCAGTITHTANTGLCSYSFTPTAPTATDNCPGVTVAGVRSDAQPLTAAYPVGTTTITWTASDVHSHSITCTQAVTITDDENPVITCPSNITHTADAGVCTYSFTPTAATATDNCPGVTVTGTRSDALALNAPYPSGTTTITWTATDAHAHIVTCMQTITVTDNEKPTIVCAPAQTVNLDANCSAVLPDYRSLLTISDNCTPANALSVTQSPAAGTALNGTGSITVTFTVTDASANSNTCSITVTKKDVTPPVIVCVAPITVNTDANVCGAVVTFGVPTATDNCTAPGGNLTFNYTGSMVTWTVPSGVTAVTVKASGAQGADGNYTNYQRGGKGGYAQGNLTVTPGETLWLAVGGQGSRSNVSPALGGFNGGGNGYNIGNTSWFVAGGGGATDIRRSGSALSNRVIVAAGGGGAGGSGSWGNGDGGNGGGLTGVDGHYSGLNGAPMDNPDINRHGKGGTQTGGGAGGTYTGGVYGTFAGGSAGTLGQGGNSDIGNNTLSGGGGGGYYGGGGGSFHGGAGGGGSSYIGGVTAGATTAGLQSGNGTINISWGGVAVSVVQTAGLPSGSVFPVGTTTNTFVATDASGNTATCSFNVTVTDNQKPVITTNGNKSVNNDAGTCGAAVTVSATATDNCGVGTPTGVRSDALALTAPYPVGTTTITWTVTDTNGNAAVPVIQTVIVTDNQKPVITANGNKSVNNDAGNCGTVVTVIATATDNCGVGAPAGVRSDALALTAPYPVGTTTITWTVTDINGNAAVAVVQTVTVTDNEIPVITTNGDKSVNNDGGNCSAAVAVSATAADNCGVGAPAGMRSDALALTAPYPVGTTTITWTVTDIHGNAATPVVQTIVVTDNQIPVIATNGDKSVNSDAGACGAVVAVSATATDNCGVGAPTGMRSDALALTAPYPVGTTTITWTVTDIHGNAAAAVTQTITVTDNEIPVITSNGNQSVNNDAGNCGAVVAVSATATDNCGVGAPIGVRSDALALTAPYPVGTTTITWTVTDIHGNAAVAVTQTVTVTDNEIPVITTNGDKSVNNDAGNCSALVAVSAIASDNCGVGAPTGVRSDALALTAPYPVGTTTITWTVTDIHGNAATPVVQTIIVTDNQIPVITTNGDKSVNSDPGNCGAVVAVSATATDNCGVVAPTGVRSDALALTAPYPVGTTTITWTVTDIHSNIAATLTQTVTVTDNEIPVITSNGNQSVNNDAGNCGAVVSVSATATDNCGVGAPAGMRSDALALTAPYPVGTTTITWTVTDIHGNAAVAVTQTVTVTDNEKPVITSNGNQSVNNDAGNCSALVAVSAAATDNCGVGAPAGMRSDALALTAPYPVGTTTITWTVTDIHGNAATPVVQTIVVTDNQIPVITTNGNKSVNSDPGTCGAVVSVSATATDNCGVGAPAGMRNDALALTAPYPVGTTTITWTVTDIHGNAAVAVTQTVTVTDNQFPVLVGVPANVTVECDAVPAPAVVSATDNCGTSVPSFTELRTNGNCPSNYTLTRTWSTTDASNNTTTATQVITVRDTKAPVLSAAPAAVTVECDAVPAPATLTATDNCDAAPVVTYTQTRTNGACANSYTLTRKWTATDACGNACSKTQVITVLDRTAPVLSAAPAAVTVECDAVPAPATLTATDNCDAAPVVTYAQARTNGACANSYTLTRTWTATDACGNASSKSQVITVLDRTAPVLSAAPAAVTVECDAVPAPATLTATDNCDANPVVTYAQTRTNGACANSYTLTRTWTATDACGNASSKSQVITVLDRTVPVLSAAPAAVTVECDAVPAPATLTATDNCDAAPVVTYAQTRTNGTSVNDYTLTRTWTATDACGNASSKTQTITVRDTKAPVLTVPSAISVNTDNNVCGATVGFTATATDNCGPVTITYSQNPATLFALGTTVVTVTAKDASGNTTVKTFTVTVTDRQPATVVTKNITIALSASGSASIAATDVNNGSSDACGIATISVSPSTFTCANVGANTVTLTVTDVNGNVSTGTAVVTVVDNTAPVVVTQNISVNLAANGTVSITPAQINNGSSDVCGIKTITVSPNTFTCANLGTNTVTLTVTDVNGNVSTGTAVVTVKDNIAPTAITKNITVALNGSGQATVVPSQVDNGSNDNCSVALSFQCASAGGQNLFSNGDFGSGFTGWSVSNVDNSGGWIATGGNPTGYYLLNSNGAVATDPTIQQTVTGLVPGQWYTISGQRNNIENGAFGNAAALSFGVAVDNTVILQLANTGKATWIPFSVQFKATATSHVIAFSAERNGDDTQYGVDNLSVVASPPASCTTGSIVFNCSNIGVNTVKLVVTDPSGNTATQTATVTVVDNLAPVITLPANATVNCGTSTAPSATGTATAADNCSTATVTYSDVTAGNVITRTWKAVDVYGNTSTAVQTITIVDNIKPVVVNPADITVTCSTLTSPSVTGTATATDNCGTPVVTYSDTWYNSTTLLRFWKATDGFGNVSNIINAQTITINDNIKPVITDPADITVNCGASTLPSATGTATATDNCGTPTVTYSDVTSGNVITRTWKATDGFGNIATSTQVITVGAVFTASVTSVPTSSTYTGGVSTNLYLGYGAQSTTLQMGSLPSGGAPYTYSWSGSFTNKLSSTTVASPVFTPATFGYYTFSVTVTNKYGCTSVATINICVTDVRVAGTSGSGAKIYVCHVTTIGHSTTYTTLQVLTSAVPLYANANCSDRLGSCDQSPCNAVVANSIVGNNSGITKEGTTEATGSDELKVTVMPNPTNTFFTLKLESKYETPVTMRVMDANGRVIDAKSKIGANSTIQIGHNYSSGTYYAELIQGTQRKVVQMVKGR